MVQHLPRLIAGDGEVFTYPPQSPVEVALIRGASDHLLAYPFSNFVHICARLRPRYRKQFGCKKQPPIPPMDCKAFPFRLRGFMRNTIHRKRGSS
jgi:hypothetical protein